MPQIIPDGYYITLLNKCLQLTHTARLINTTGIHKHTNREHKLSHALALTDIYTQAYTLTHIPEFKT